MNLRPATTDDTEGVCHVVRAVYDEYGFSWDPEGYHADLYDLQAHYFDHGDLFWVGELEGQIAATVALEFFERIPGTLGELACRTLELPRVAGTDCSLERLYVHPNARRHGLGTALTELAVNEAKARGRRAMELWSDKRFGDAHRLYGRFGAKVVGERICDDPERSPEWGLLIELT